MPINQLTDDGFGFLAGSSGATPSFAPSDIAGLKLWLDADAANVNTEAAADFNGTNQYLSSASTELLFTQSESFSFGGWCKNGAVGKKLMGSNEVYLIASSASGGSWRCIANGYLAQIGGSHTSGAWTFVVGTVDATSGVVKLSVNGSAYTSVSYSGTYSTTDFKVGVAGTTQYWDGAIDLPFVYNRAISEAEVTALYNSGNATAYSSLSAAQKTDLVSWWSLSETSGTRYDQHGTNNLTDNGSVGWAAGVLDEPVVNNSPVSLWIDKSTATNNATQATAIAQPTWNISGGSNGTSFIDFDGSTDYLSSVNFSPDVLSAGNQTFTFLSVFKLNSLPAANQIILSLSETGNAYNRFELRLSSTGELRILIRESLADGGNFVQTDVSTADTNWHYVLWTFDNDTLNCWLDGVKVIDNTSQGLDEILPQSFTLGALDSGSISFNADCSISECISYNNVVTAGQISDLDSYINGIYSL